ncbi:hypothetical protein QBC46DRAFT_265306 [Diplogelasinospora grovesii]|uniref:Cupin 2 conserved barrel domain-containing protein n=1 Tax=Diplogelasinospora grovesii TaxID=303347 RepID=A0AAN6N6W1_9PEZI|nr:hypothetical protein QBC46DRAFT_265306 [Diplogelasinospora grovesii]
MIGKLQLVLYIAFCTLCSAGVTAPDLPDPSRVITDVNTDGKSVFYSGLPVPVPVVENLNGALFRLGYITERPPVSINDETDIDFYEASLENLPPLVPAGGGPAVWYIDTPPNASSPLHRTISIDIVVQLQGEIELTLDSGETRLLKTGDLTIQRAAMHAWRNPSLTEWSRMIGVMSEVQPVVVGNTTITATLPTAT